MKKTFLLIFAVLILSVSAVHGQITFVFFSSDGPESTGDALDGLTTAFSIVDGLKLTATAGVPGNSLADPQFNYTSRGFGINDRSTAADQTYQFDAGQIMTFSFDQDVLLESITINLFSGSDYGSLSTSGTNFALDNNGFSSLSGTYVPAGTEITFSVSAGSFSLSSIDVTPVSAIPEPSTYGAILGGLTLGGAYLRRRKVKVA